ncbi:hypothetical protein F4810DRAFT_697222 [Camillea tinctor]|nr:hypothetical protein F4810DRAFT_697222 [Camillea tinctor]
MESSTPTEEPDPEENTSQEAEPWWLIDSETMDFIKRIETYPDFLPGGVFNMTYPSDELRDGNNFGDTDIRNTRGPFGGDDGPAPGGEIGTRTPIPSQGEQGQLSGQAYSDGRPNEGTRKQADTSTKDQVDNGSAVATKQSPIPSSQQISHATDNKHAVAESAPRPAVKYDTMLPSIDNDFQGSKSNMLSNAEEASGEPKGKKSRKRSHPSEKATGQSGLPDAGRQTRAKGPRLSATTTTAAGARLSRGPSVSQINMYSGMGANVVMPHQHIQGQFMPMGSSRPVISNMAGPNTTAPPQGYEEANLFSMQQVRVAGQAMVQQGLNTQGSTWPSFPPSNPYEKVSAPEQNRLYANQMGASGNSNAYAPFDSDRQLPNGTSRYNNSSSPEAGAHNMPPLGRANSFNMAPSGISAHGTPPIGVGGYNMLPPAANSYNVPPPGVNLYGMGPAGVNIYNAPPPVASSYGTWPAVVNGYNVPLPGTNVYGMPYRAVAQIPRPAPIAQGRMPPNLTEDQRREAMARGHRVNPYPQVPRPPNASPKQPGGHGKKGSP